MMSITSHGILRILSSSVHLVKRTDGSSFGTHDVCFYFRPPFLSTFNLYIHPESRYIQQCQMKVSPVQTSYSPDGRSLLYASAGHQLSFMTLGKVGDGTKEEWQPFERDTVCVYSTIPFVSSLNN